MEWVKDISGILGMILSATSVFVLIKTKVLANLVHMFAKNQRWTRTKG